MNRNSEEENPGRMCWWLRMKMYWARIDWIKKINDDDYGYFERGLNRFTYNWKQLFYFTDKMWVAGEKDFYCMCYKEMCKSLEEVNESLEGFRVRYKCGLMDPHYDRDFCDIRESIACMRLDIDRWRRTGWTEYTTRSVNSYRCVKYER